MLIGYDLDGVLCYDGWPKFIRRHGINAHKQKVLTYIPRAQVKIRPLMIKPYVIITSRPGYAQDATIEWLETNGFDNYEIYFIDRPRLPLWNMVNFKAEMIRKLSVTIFFEDDHAIVKALREKCPNTKIIEVKK